MVKEKKAKIAREVSEKKLKIVSEIEKLIKDNKTFMICSIKNLPGKQFQEIKKKLRDKVKMRVLKKSTAIRAIENSGIEIKKIKEHVKEDVALVFSKIEVFELSALLSENKTAVGAKKGQLAEEDILIEAGPTELTPGPVISELGALGLKIAIEDGKISIKEKKIIVKAGEMINDSAVGIMSKFDIKPFKIGFEPIAAYDNEEKKVYINIKVDREKTLDELKKAYSKALAFAVKIVYPCKETIIFILGKAGIEEKALSKLIKSKEENIQQNTQGG